MKTMLLVVLCAVGFSGCASIGKKNIRWTRCFVAVGPLMTGDITELSENYDPRKMAWIPEYELGLKNDGSLVWRKVIIDTSTAQKKTWIEAPIIIPREEIISGGKK